LLVENIKSELCSERESDACCPRWELLGFLEVWGQDGAERVRVDTDFAPVARRLYALLRAAGARKAEVVRQCGRGRRGYRITADRPGGAGPRAGSLAESTGESTPDRRTSSRRTSSGRTSSGRTSGGRTSARSQLPFRRCCLKAYVRGAFLARGFVSVANRGYHWEIKAPDCGQAERIAGALASLGLEGARVGRWQNGWVAYLKDSELIAEWLRLVGAHDTLLKFEDIRVKKEMRNKVTRRVNYETANLSRAVTAALKQKEDIELLAEKVGLDHLPSSLRVLAEVRLSQPQASLAELGALFDPPLSKSAVNHRMRRIAALADDVRCRRPAPRARRR